METLEAFYRRLSRRQLQEIIDRITDQIDYNPEQNALQIAAADEARERKALIERVMETAC